MNTLLDNLKAIYLAAIAAGTVSAKSVCKGLHEDPTQISIGQYPYICLDDGGERTEDANSQDGQWHYYSVIFEFAAYTTNKETALTSMLTLSDEIKAVLELETNRQKDGHIWAVSIVPYAWEQDAFFYRGRSVIVDFREFESTYLQF